MEIEILQVDWRITYPYSLVTGFQYDFSSPQLETLQYEFDIRMDHFPVLKKHVEAYLGRDVLNEPGYNKTIIIYSNLGQ